MWKRRASANRAGDSETISMGCSKLATLASTNPMTQGMNVQPLIIPERRLPAVQGGGNYESFVLTCRWRTLINQEKRPKDKCCQLQKSCACVFIYIYSYSIQPIKPVQYLKPKYLTKLQSVISGNLPSKPLF